VPITPFPTLFTAPVYRPTNNTVELTVSNFFYKDVKTKTEAPLDVYLGNLGPLPHRIYQAPPPGPLTNISPFAQTMPTPQGIDGSPTEGTPGSPTAGTRYITSGPLHTIVIVEMPALADVIKALEQDALPSGVDGSGSIPHSPRPTDGTPTHDPRSGSGPPQLSIAGRSLPLLFIRPSDGVGYHSGRTIACENVFQTISLGTMTGNPPGGGSIDTNWLAAAQAAAAAAADGSLQGWTLRVM
jgi:recombining binding protein (suppressor of hairless)